MLQVYTRHQAPCAITDQSHKRCSCPKWVRGTPEGGKGYIRQSAGTDVWSTAEKKAHQMDQESLDRKLGRFVESDSSASVEISQAIPQFITSKKYENVSEATMVSYANVLEEQFLKWCHGQGYKFMSQLTPDAMMNVSDLWKGNGQIKANKSGTARIKYTRINSFLLYALRRGWVKSNPLQAAFRCPRIGADAEETQPLDPTELKMLVDRTYFPIRGSHSGEDHRIKLRALLLLMRYSGLAITDAVTLERSRLGPQRDLPADALELRRTKTNKAIYIPLPPRIATLLRSLDNPDPRYFFWNGSADLNAVKDTWRQSLKSLAKAAGFDRRFHPHMMRCTFAVEQLIRGTSYEDVALLLGNTPAVVFKHYAPMVRERREKLGKLAQKAWDDSEVWQEPKKSVASATA